MTVFYAFNVTFDNEESFLFQILIVKWKSNFKMSFWPIFTNICQEFIHWKELSPEPLMKITVSCGCGCAKSPARCCWTIAGEDSASSSQPNLLKYDVYICLTGYSPVEAPPRYCEHAANVESRASHTSCHASVFCSVSFHIYINFSGNPPSLKGLPLLMWRGFFSMNF